MIILKKNSPPRFNTSIEANAYFNAWKTQKDKFVEKLRIDPSPRHYKVSMERSKVLFVQISSKNNAKKILKGFNSSKLINFLKLTTSTHIYGLT
jgi:hypothetical protein